MIDEDVRRFVDDMQPTSLGQRTALENTLQRKRDDARRLASPAQPEVRRRTFNEELAVSHGVYADMKPPYECSRCHVTGVKLWREYQSFELILRCARCSCLVQGIVYDVDEKGVRQGSHGPTDQIGWDVPAVTDPDGGGFWGYTSTPLAHYALWENLPTERPWPSAEDLEDLTDRWHDGAWPEISLEQVIRDATGWTKEQVDVWAATGRMA